MRKYSFWLRTAAVIQFITAIIHSMTLFVTPPPANETERLLFDLMKNYQFDFGKGFLRSMDELTIALSACFSLVCLLGGAINWYLLRKQTPLDTMKGILNINLVIFGTCFALMAVFTFLPPIVLTGLIAVCLLLARVTIKGESRAT